MLGISTRRSTGSCTYRTNHQLLQSCVLVLLCSSRFKRCENFTFRYVGTDTQSSVTVLIVLTPHFLKAESFILPEDILGDVKKSQESEILLLKDLFVVPF